MSVRAELDAHGLAPRKKWGQNFLTDPRILESIADAAELTDTDVVLEIGPGMGHLTRVLARRARNVVAVEVDPGLTARLETEFADTPNVKIVFGDVLQAEPHAWVSRALGEIGSFKIVANLPYYITSAILRHVLQAAHKPRVMVVMVQREVAQRLIAHPPDMNLLAVSVQFFAQVQVMRVIPAGAFYPRPKVDSAVVRLDVFTAPPAHASDVRRFFQIVRAGFGTRRKQLRNALMNGLGLPSSDVLAALAQAHIEPMRRAETLTLFEWANLVRAFEAGTYGGLETKNFGG
ncbi:MAG: ribosomal RNA small subunit methyltransferase A [Chloroflexi bacterium]|nr:ribosomal RNA small subunit methyltransferase A [Chloroflexota bacterium]